VFRLHDLCPQLTNRNRSDEGVDTGRAHLPVHSAFFLVYEIFKLFLKASKLTWENKIVKTVVDRGSDKFVVELS